MITEEWQEGCKCMIGSYNKVVIFNTECSVESHKNKANKMLLKHNHGVTIA